MSALEKAKQAGRETTVEKIRQSGLKEFGVYAENLADKIERIQAEHTEYDGPLMAAGALNNEDTEQMLLFLAEEMPEKVLDGLSVLSYLVGAEESILYVPEGRDELRNMLKQKAEKLGVSVQIEEGIADVRRLRGSIISHIETLAALSDVIGECYEPGTYVCIKIKSAVDTEYKTTYQTECMDPVFVPYGTKPASLIPEDLEGIKAVKIGSHLYDPSVLDVEITDETDLGNGVITIFTDRCCMIAASEEQLLEKRKASCGKCTFCREGLGQLYTRIHEITIGKGDFAGLDIMKELGEAMPFSSLCSLGQRGADFTIDTLRLFPEEYEAHIKKRKCPSGQCAAFINMYIDPSACTGCGKCIPSCPVDCIEGLPGYIYMIEDIDCTKCGKCMEVCEENAIIRTEKRVPSLPDRLTRVGRFKRY